MKLYFKILIISGFLTILIGCGENDEPRPNFQFYADKEKELNDREARVMLKEKELEERENRLNNYENPANTNSDTTQTSITQTINPEQETIDSTVKRVKNEKKKEIQKEMNRKFENPTSTVKDYFEYIQRGVSDESSFDANMKKAAKLFPSRSSEKLKSNYKKTKKFTVLSEPKVKSQKDNKSTVSAKVKQVEMIDNKEVTRNITVTYSLTANDQGQWVITGASLKTD